MPTINDLRQQAATIKNATQVGENTATRVGTTFKTIADLLEGMGGVTNLSTIDIGSIDTLNTTGDMLVGTPNIYTLTKTIGANTFKVGTLFQFANNGRYDVAQVIVSQFIVDGDGRIDTTSADQEVHIFYRLCKTMNGGSLPTPIGTWTTWTELGGSGGSGVTIDPYPTQNSGNAVSSGGVFERLQDIAPKIDISAIDDIDEYSDMLATKSPFYVVTKTLSGNVFRIGTLMEFANQGRYILYQILATDYILNDDGTLDTTLSENGGLKLIWRMKQFSGNPPEGVIIGQWSKWSYFGGDSGYQPDNEDIDLNASDQLQFANKSYDASAFSGLGRVYLRKNIVTSGDVKKNVLTQAMVNTANTIYHIQYDYDLNGQTITMPTGCVIEFDGGSISNGSLVCQNTSITSDKLYQIFKQVKVSGTLLNSRINVIWFGIMPNDETIDATQIITNYIQGYKGEIYFPQGNYYLSEWHYTNTPNDCLQIVGDPDVGLGSTTAFYPFANNQRYIIKIGGAEDAINGTGIAWNVRIMDISFATPEEYAPTDLSIGYANVPVPYPHAALILDAVGKGRFGINGSVHNTPLVVIGYVGEATFDYITCYTCQGKSDMPVISIINSTNKSVTASIIKRLECETIAGSVIWACSESSTSELYINNVFYEGTVCFSAPNGCLSDQQKYTEPIDYNQYTQVPIFDFSGYAKPQIDRISLTQTDITWLNSKDEGNTRCVRTLYNGNGVGGNFNIREIINNYDSKYLAVKSKSSASYRGGISVQNIFNSSIIPLDSGAAVGGIINVEDDKYYNTQLRLDTKVYKGQELYSIQETIKDSSGNLQCFPTYTNIADAPVIRCQVVNNAFLIRKDGFYIDSDTAFISLTAYKLGSTNIIFWLFYFDGNGEQIGDKVIHKFTMTAQTWNTYDIPIDVSRNFAYIKLQYPSGNGYASYIKDITIVPQNVKHIASASTTNDLGIGDSVLIGTTNKLAKYGYTINGIVKEVTSPDSNAVTFFENQDSIFVVKFLSTFNNPIYVRFLKEQDWNSADYVEITLPAYTYERVFEPLDKTVYPYVGMKCVSSFSYYVYKLGKKIINGDGIFVDVNRIGIDSSNYASLTPRPKVGEVPIGFAYYDYGRKKINFVSDIINGAILWREADGAKAGVVRSGTFANKPSSADVYIGFRYFCTDKQTTEGATNGIEIIYKGNDVWVDALGRVVS